MRNGKSWGACHSLKKLWNSDLRDRLKVRVFVALVDSVLLYVSETWTMSKTQEAHKNVRWLLHEDAEDGSGGKPMERQSQQPGAVQRPS